MSEARSKNVGIHPAIIIIILIFATIVASYYLYRASLSNAKGGEGNTTLNLFNGGEFCESDDRIYFSNPNDHGVLYSMDQDLSDYRFIYEDSAGYINNTTAYIVYSRQNYKRDDSIENVLQFSDSGLYRINKKNVKDIDCFSFMQCTFAALYGNDIYYLLPKKGKSVLCSADLTNLKKKKDEPVSGAAVMIPGSFTENGILYSGIEKDHYLSYFNPETGENKVIYKGSTTMPALVGEHIYFIAADDDYSIKRCDPDGRNVTNVVDERCSAYNITEDEQYLVCQIEDGRNSHLAVVNIETGAKTIVSYGNYNSISIIANRVFFKKYKTEKFMYFDISDPLSLKNFEPPDLTDDGMGKGSSSAAGGTE